MPMHPEDCINFKRSLSFEISMLACVNHQRFSGIIACNKSLMYSRLIVRLSSQNQTILRCHQCLKLSYEISRTTSETGRVLKPGLSVGTVQKEQVNGQPRVACNTRGIKKES